mmetsp:Transcript_90140/g.200290  ORF Transcript_90140/g.200290 Transcript_90140/m.200290 type:complete len:233 (+) Transcript_90140:41-739(+)
MIPSFSTGKPRGTTMARPDASCKAGCSILVLLRRLNRLQCEDGVPGYTHSDLLKTRICGHLCDLLRHVACRGSGGKESTPGPQDPEYLLQRQFWVPRHVHAQAPPSNIDLSIAEGQCLHIRPSQIEAILGIGPLLFSSTLRHPQHLPGDVQREDTAKATTLREAPCHQPIAATEIQGNAGAPTVHAALAARHYALLLVLLISEVQEELHSHAVVLCADVWCVMRMLARVVED